MTAMMTIALPNGTFWEIASFFILVAVSVITLVKYWSERRRKLKLIVFPDEWVAYRRKNQSILEITIVAEVLIPHHALAYKAFAEIEGKIIEMQFSKPLTGFVGERWIMGGKTPLSPISLEAKTIEASVEIQLDGDIKRSSGKRTIIIIDA